MVAVKDEMKDYYSILGVLTTASTKEIKKAYKSRIRVVHPDRFDQIKQPDEWHQSNEMLTELNEAYYVLSNPSTRYQYDEKLCRSRSSTREKIQTEHHDRPSHELKDNKNKHLNTGIAGSILRLIFSLGIGSIGISLVRYLRISDTTIMIIFVILSFCILGYIGNISAKILIIWINDRTTTKKTKVSLAWIVGIVSILCIITVHAIISDIRENVVDKEVAANNKVDNQARRPVVLPPPQVPEGQATAPAAPVVIPPQATPAATTSPASPAKPEAAPPAPYPQVPSAVAPPVPYELRALPALPPKAPSAPSAAQILPPTASTDPQAATNKRQSQPLQSRSNSNNLTSSAHRFITYSNGTVLDSVTGLMWAQKDNGKNINWHDAKIYCDNYRGGGHTNWRMPTHGELATLYDKSIQGNNGYHVTRGINLTGCCSWAAETRGSDAAFFIFNDGNLYWTPKSTDILNRALPVRSAK